MSSNMPLFHASRRRTVLGLLGGLGAATGFGWPRTGRQASARPGAQPSRCFVAYYPSWWHTARKQLADHVPVYTTTLAIAFCRPDIAFDPELPSFAGTGLQFAAAPDEIGRQIAALRLARPGIKVLLSVGGASYDAWGDIAREGREADSRLIDRGRAPRLRALLDLASMLDVDGLDLDYERDAGVNAAEVADYRAVLRGLRAVVDALPRGPKAGELAVAVWSTGADFTARTGPGPRGISWFGGNAGREREVFDPATTALVTQVSVMAYDVPVGSRWSPVTAWLQYRAVFPRNVSVAIGLQPPNEGGSDAVLAVRTRDVVPGVARSWIGTDQYGAKIDMAYSVEALVGFVVEHGGTRDGAMLWSCQKPAAGDRAVDHKLPAYAATPTTAARAAASLLGLTDDRMNIDFGE